MFGGEGGSSSQRFLDENSQQSDERVENSSSEIGPDIPIEIETPFGGRNRLKEAIVAKDGDLVGQILDEIENQSIPFKEAAFMMTECFGELFGCYQNRIKKMLFDNVLCWPVGTVRLPLDTFQKSKLETLTSWTCDLEPESLLEHLEQDQKTLASYVEGKILDRVKNEVGLELIDAKVGCFCVENVCSAGLDGIIRPFLLGNVEKSIFKSELMKQTIMTKLRFFGFGRPLSLERYPLKENTTGYFASRELIGMGLYSYCCYVLFIGLNSGELRNMSTSRQVWLAVAHLITFTCSVPAAIYDFIGMKRQIEDFRLLFLSSNIRPIIHLTIQYETIIDVLHAVLILIIIPLFHFGTYISDSFRPWLVVAIALSIFVYIEKWSLSSILIVPYVVLSSSITRFYYVLRGILPWGFVLLFSKYLLIIEVSAVFYILSNYEHKSNDQNEKEETQNKDDATNHILIHDTFGNYWRVLFNVISAFFGTFDPEVYLHSGPLSSWIIVIFVAFIFSQMVVFFNVVIAWIGQLFEEHLTSIKEISLIEQAKTMDRIEASIPGITIEHYRLIFGRYLYVVYPAEEIEQEEVVWEGRVKTIVENIKMMVRKSNKDMEKRMMDRLKEKMDTLEQRTNDTLEKILTKLESLEEDIRRRSS